jgi:hypothetical protein
MDGVKDSAFWHIDLLKMCVIFILIFLQYMNLTQVLKVI